MTLEAVGIDFGTTNTVVAVRENGKTRVLPLDPGADNPTLLKTLLYFPNRKTAFFGKSAIYEYFEQGMEGRFFQSIKRLLPNPDFTGTSLFGTHAGIEDLISAFLRDVKRRIEKEVGPIGATPVFFGRPARYSQEPPREGLAVVRFKRSVEMAGFDLQTCRFVEEPVAAAKSVSQSPATGKPGPITLISDLGGGTSDYTLFQENADRTIHTFSVHGVPLAGDALDSDFFVARLNEPFGAGIRYQRPFSSNILTLPTLLLGHLPKWHHHAFLRERTTWNFIITLRKELVDPEQKPKLENLITLVEENLGYKLHLQVEALKIALSEKAKEEFSFKSYPIDIGFDVTKSEMDQMTEKTVDEILKAALETCKYGKIAPEEVEVVQHTGGTSKVPIIRERLKKAFPNARTAEHETFTAVAEGLAMGELK